MSQGAAIIATTVNHLSALRRTALVLASLALCAYVSAAEAPRHTDRDSADFVGPVRDLAYGEALFEFYKGDHFAAATRLLIAARQDTLKHHRDDGRLLLGGLYLSYGLQNDAVEIFSALLKERAPGTANRAWMYLAEIAWQRGNTIRAKQALGNMGRDLDEGLAAAHGLLTARIAIDEERFDDAIAVLEDWRGGRELVSYAQFNLGVALIRHGQLTRGARLLDQVGRGHQRNPGQRGWRHFELPRLWLQTRVSDRPDEHQALRDRANLALGFAWLQNGQAQRARNYLQKVDNESPWFTRASLGAGWAATELGEHSDAVNYWTQLRERDHLDPAVQESLLAIPFARNSMGDEPQALQEYQFAIRQFEYELNVLREFQKELDQGSFVRALLRDNETGSVGWFWNLRTLPDTDVSRYLYHLIADHAFQEGLKNYRDLVDLKNNLKHWQEKIAVYEAMLDARRQRYDRSMEVQRGGEESQRLARLRDRWIRVQQRLTDIEASGDRVALATPGEQEQWQRLQSIQNRLGTLPVPDHDIATDKHRLLKGVLIWNFEQQYSARLWEMKQAEQHLRRAVSNGQKLEESLRTAREQAPVDFTGFQQRIETLAPRIDAQLTDVIHALGQHESYLADLTGRQFQQHRERLTAYLAEARFALASTFDRAAQNGEPAP
ncbi:MAG: hypothetical protein HKN70_01765 [Gammaproteobacteria bacterium]|nr:hypothetical protein [Gammaproteobacteria bacterium]